MQSVPCLLHLAKRSAFVASRCSMLLIISQSIALKRMIRAAVFLSTGLLALAIGATAVKVGGSYEESCSLFMAPSTIPGAGWGVFTAVDIAEGESIGEPESIIPVIDNFKTLPYRGQQHFLSWLGYVWPAEPNFFYRATQESFPTIPKAMYKVDPGLNKATALEFTDEEGDYVSAFIPGIASLVNSDYDDANIEYMEQNKQAAFVASDDIEAGSELFFYYGDTWDDDLEKREKSQVEYNTLEEYVENVLPYRHLPDEEEKRAALNDEPRKMLGVDDDDEEAECSDAYIGDMEFKHYIGDIVGKARNSIRNFKIATFFSTLDGIKTFIKNAHEKRIAQAQDLKGKRVTTVEDELLGNDEDERDDYEQSEEADLTKKQKIDWLKEHGMCIDNLKSGPSKKRGAARFSNRRGAFAKKHIPKGERIAPAPLLALKRDDLNIYKADESQRGVWRSVEL